uniref:Uncharacterized protein n=1 Tax=Saimiri boliviensis boliviensis TaxID=39432 RepID=A0A2K6SST8_SAIBB
MSLKNCKGENINVLIKKWVLNLLSPCFSNQGVRTLLSLRCLLLAANSAAVCCSEEYGALEGSVPFKTKNHCPGCPHKRSRDFFFKIPATVPSHRHSQNGSDSEGL